MSIGFNNSHVLISVLILLFTEKFSTQKMMYLKTFSICIAEFELKHASYDFNEE